MMKNLASLIFLAPLALSAVSASAAGGTSETISNLHITLVDLDPGDGIAPSINFDTYGHSTAFSEVAVAGGLSDSKYFSGIGPFAPVMSNAWLGALFGASASITGDAFTTGATVHTSASSEDIAQMSIGESTIGFGNDVQDVGFTLSAHTALVISGDESFSATVEHRQASEQADGGMILEIMAATPGGPAGVILNPGVYMDQSMSGTSRSVDESFTATFSNTTASTIGGSLSGYLGSYAISQGTPSQVPEPLSAAMLLTGVMVVASRARRRGAPY